MEPNEKTGKMGRNVKLFMKALAIFLGKLILKIGIVVIIGVALSYAINYILGIKLGETMCFVGVIVAIIGVGLQFGEVKVRNNYNYNMTRITNTKIFEKDYKGYFTEGNVYFFIWMASSGIILFLIGDAIIRA